MAQRKGGPASGKDISRRAVLTLMGSSAVAGGALLRSARAGQARSSTESSSGRPEVRVAYLRPKEKYWLGWPGTSWDPDVFMQKSRTLVEQYATENEVRVSFEPQPLYDAPAAEQFIARLKTEKPDGVVLFPLHMERWPQIEAIGKAVPLPSFLQALELPSRDTSRTSAGCPECTSHPPPISS